jgi:hypothetical protein
MGGALRLSWNWSSGLKSNGNALIPNGNALILNGNALNDWRNNYGPWVLILA